MKKIFLVLLCAASVSLTCNADSYKALQGKFTINSDGDQVSFGSGNFYFTMNQEPYFAEHQYDIQGNENANIGRSVVFTRDHFTYQYAVDKQLGGWRLLTSDEWKYLLFTRDNASTLFLTAKVNDIAGLILLPDDWTTPAGITYIQSTEFMIPFYAFDYYGNDNYSNFNLNAFTLTEWDLMEANGAVFLPAAGKSEDKNDGTGSTVTEVGTAGYYWAADEYNYTNWHCLHFNEGEVSPTDAISKTYDTNFRLVLPVEKSPATAISQPKSDSAKASKTIVGGQLVIRKDGKTYNALGEEIK